MAFRNRCYWLRSLKYQPYASGWCPKGAEQMVHFIGNFGNAFVSERKVDWTKEKFREEYVRRRAKELAKSGRFEPWQGIEFELRFIEVPEARFCLGGEPIREELDILRRQVKSRRPSPTSKAPDWGRSASSEKPSCPRQCPSQ